MPQDTSEWKAEELEQAKESILLLSEAGVGLRDIKPANFVKLTDQSSAKRGRVVAIDLECYFQDTNAVELPLWLTQGCSSLISAG